MANCCTVQAMAWSILFGFCLNGAMRLYARGFKSFDSQEGLENILKNFWKTGGEAVYKQLIK
ncbi:MAG: hypothetical protein ACKOAD_01225 [Gammaproteobacteria bacterium]